MPLIMPVVSCSLMAWFNNTYPTCPFQKNYCGPLTVSHCAPWMTASQPTGLALPLSKLTVLDLSKNRITSTEPFAHLMTSLEELWLSSNNIENFEQLKFISLAAANCINEGEIRQQRLQGIYLEFNPVSEEFEYRKHLAELIGPSLEAIDGVRISGYNVLNQPGAFVSLEDQLRMFQEQAIERARMQQQAASKVTTDHNER